jgi:hypothetical protein
MGLLDRFRGDPLLASVIDADQEHLRRQRAAYEANVTGDLDPKRQQRFIAERQFRGLGNALMGLGDLANMGINAGIRDVDYFTGGGLSGGSYDPYQLGMPSDTLADVASRVHKAISGQDVIDPASMPGDVRRQGERAEQLFGMLPLGAEDIAPAAKLAMSGLGGLSKVMQEGKAARRAITSVSLRELPPAEALSVAKSQQHLISQPDGGFVGAPDSVRSMKDLARVRRNFDSSVLEGLGGAEWYDRIRNGWLERVAGPDRNAQSELAHNLALMSSQADPKANLAFSVRARNAAIMGMPVDIVHTGRQAREYQEAYETGTLPKTGKKTGIFARTMDPQMDAPVTGTNDIWHARAFGYTNPKTGKPWSAALSPQQHAFMDAETVLAVDRANKAKLGGRDDWTAGEIQAAAWVTGKGKALVEKWNRTGPVMRGERPKMTDEEGIALASKTFPDYEEAVTGYGQHEMTPGAQGHLPLLQAGDEALRERYAANPRAWWKGPGGRDILYSSEGAYTAPTETMTGIFEGGTNPGQSARPLIASEGKTGKRVMDPASRQLMSGTEAFRAFMDAQKSGAFVGVLPQQAAAHANAYLMKNLPKEMQTASGLLGLMGKAEEAGLPANVVHFGGPKGLLTDFRETGGVPTKERKAVQGLLGEMGVEAEPVRREGALTPRPSETMEYGGYDWSQPGSDTATKQMLSEINPAQRKAFESPQVRMKVLQRMEQDEAFSKIGGGVRKDIQYVRRLFAEKGFKGIEAEIGKGLLPVAALGIFLPYLSEKDRKNGSS